MQLDQPLDQRQAQSGPRLAAAAAALEALEDPVLVGFRDAHAGIGDRQLDAILPAPCADGHASTLRGEFDRVRQQIEQGLLQPQLVGGLAPDIGGAIEHQLDSAVARPLESEIVNALEQRMEIHLFEVEAQVAGLDGGQVEDVVDQGMQALRGLDDGLAVFQLPFVELAEVLVFEDLGETDDGVERRAELIGHVGDELRLQPVGGLQRFVAFPQGLLHPGRIRHIQESEEIGPIGQRNLGPFDHRAVGPLAAPAARIGLRRFPENPLHQGRPVAVRSIEIGPGLRDHLAHVRLAAQEALGQAPEPRVDRVEQLETPIGPVDRNAFEEMIQSLALHRDQSVVGTLQRQAVGDVLERHQDAAEGVGRRRQAQGRPVGQVQQVLQRLDQGAEQADLIALIGRKVRLLGQTPLIAQQLMDVVEMRLVFERLLLEAQQTGIGGVEELEAHVRAEDGDAAAERLQHFGMGLDVPLELALQLLASRPVERHAGGFADVVSGAVFGPGQPLGR